jgi:NAD(P)H-dependent flavin oxidoreductase YrpB (nitropropane dioxygenase family)
LPDLPDLLDKLQVGAIKQVPKLTKGGDRMDWTTRVTKRFGCKYPILEGAMVGLGSWELAAAISEAGGLGCITAAASHTPERLRDDIRRYKDASDKPFSVNISIGMCPHEQEMLDVILAEDVPVVETSITSPGNYGQRIKEAKRLWIHKVATVKYAVSAAKQQPDAIIIVGLDGAGFKNITQLPTFTQIAWAARQVKEIPIIAAGGIGNGRTFLASLALGAEGVMMGTAFMATQECHISQPVKESIIKAIPEDPKLIFELVAPPDPKAFEEIMKKKNEMPLEKWLPALERVQLKHKEWEQVPEMWKQDAQELAGHFSFASAYFDHSPTCKELIDTIVKEAEEILDSWEFLKARSK